MTFLHLVYKNFRSSLKRYMIYLFCCILSIAVLFAYTTLITNQSLTHAFRNPALLKLFEVSHVVLGIFALFFISYTLRAYFIGKKNEFAIFQMLGCSKVVIIKNIIVESGLILFISMIGGCLLGLLFSFLSFQCFQSLLSYSDAYFYVSFRTFISTFLIFGSVFLSQTILGAVYVGSISPLILIQKKTKKTTKSYVLFCGLGLMLLVNGYIQFYKEIAHPTSYENPYKPFFISAFIGITLIIYNLDRVIALIEKGSKKFYYGNLVLIKNLCNNFNQTRKLMLVLTMVMFLVVTLVSTVLSTYLNAIDTTQQTQPYEVMAYMDLDPILIEKFDSSLRAVYEGEKYQQNSLAIIPATQWINIGEEPTEQHVMILSLNAYNALVGTTLRLEDHEYYSHMNDLYKNVLEAFPYTETEFIVEQSLHTLSFAGQSRKPILNMQFLDTNHFIVVSDSTYALLPSNGSKALIVYQLDDWNSAQLAVNRLNSKNLEAAEIKYITANDYLKNYKQETGTRLFIVFFIGVLFVIAGIGMQILKTLNDREAYKLLYDRLSALGMTKSKIKKNIMRDNGITLLLPYFLGAFLGYLYTIISSMHSPAHAYFVKDLLIFITVFLVISTLIYHIIVNKILKSMLPL